MRRVTLALCAAVLGIGLWAGAAQPVQAQNYNINNKFYYPYYYFPHNYWPVMSPQWPEPPGAPYMQPPAYMAYPAFREPHWHYDLWERRTYHSGFHFWLDQF